MVTCYQHVCGLPVELVRVAHAAVVNQAVDDAISDIQRLHSKLGVSVVGACLRKRWLTKTGRLVATPLPNSGWPTMGMDRQSTRGSVG